MGVAAATGAQLPVIALTSLTPPTPELPVARVLPLLPLPHLDREFDYLVPPALADEAKPGVRVRIRFSGRLIDGVLLERLAASEHQGKLGSLERVISADPVLTPEVSRLIGAVAEHYAGTRADVLRLALPPRHAAAEAGEAKVPMHAVVRPAPESGGWDKYRFGSAFVEAAEAGRPARAVWQATADEDWPTRLAELAGVVAARGRSAVLLVPDQKDLDRLEAACVRINGKDAVVALAAGLGPQARYRRWLMALHGKAKVIVGTRSAAFTPVRELGLLALWDDGDESYAEPRAPYPHAREVATMRAHESGAALVVGGYSRTTEAQLLVESGWAHDLVAPREVLREHTPRIFANADSDLALERDPLAKAARIPAAAFALVRATLAEGAPVLVQVPRAGYVPSLACAECRTSARCRACNGPLTLHAHGADEAAAPVCAWCGRPETRFTCAACGSHRLRAVTIGAGRTAEELGRAFPGSVVRNSSGEKTLATVPRKPSLVIATVGAEPIVDGGYGAALLLDGWAMLGRPDLRAEEEALRRWMTAAALVDGGGQVMVMAEAGAPTTQALIRWDAVGHAREQLAQRREVGLPPAVHLAAVDGSPRAIRDLVDAAALPADVVELGPVPLPAGGRAPLSEGREGADDGEVERLLLRVPRSDGRRLASALRTARTGLSARGVRGFARVQIDPQQIE